MTRALGLFLKQKTTILGIVILLLFQLIFGIIWLNGYDGVTNRMEQLKIGVVTEDQQVGRTIAYALLQNMPFDMQRVDSLDEAKEQLNTRDLKAVVHIPADFTEKSMQAGKLNLEVLVNESNPALVKQVGQQVLNQVTANVNTQVTTQGVSAILRQANIPTEQVEKMAGSVVNRVEGHYEALNPISNFAHQMLPMMLVLASYVGAMLLSMQLNLSTRALRNHVSVWQAFWSRQIINVIAAGVTALVASSLLTAFGVDPVGGFWGLTGFLLLTILSFACLAQTFLYLFGEAGMLFNIIALSLQLATSGVLVPRELLSNFFQGIGDVLPATYAATGNLNLLFGGSGTAGAVQSVLWIIGATLVLAMIGATIQNAAAKKRAAGQKVVA